MFELYEIKPADFGGTYTSWAKSLTSEDKVHAESNFQRAIQGTGDFDVTFSIKWPDNSQRFIRATAYVLRNKKGQAVRMLGTNWDITEEEQLKRDLRFNNSILEESSASSALEAVMILLKEPPFDLLITDYKMPLVDGLAFVIEIRESMKISEDELPVILVHSSSDDASIIDKAKGLGIRFKLTKPLNTEDLYHKISRIHSNLAIEAVELVAKDLKNTSIDDAARPKILIAEDVDLNRILIKALLKRYLPNASIFEALDGKDVVAKFEDMLPDLIFMDIQMPKQDGYVSTILISALQKDMKSCGVRIVALTAHAMNLDKRKRLVKGANISWSVYQSL